MNIWVAQLIYMKSELVILPILGVIPGFCTAGILGFDGDIIDSNLRKVLFSILLVYVLGITLKSSAIYMNLLSTKYTWGYK